MRKFLAFVILLGILFPFAHPANFSRIDRIPQSYDYAFDYSWYLNPGSASQWTEELGISSAKETNARTLIELSADEKKAFRRSLEYFNKSDADMMRAKELLGAASMFRRLREMASWNVLVPSAPPVGLSNVLAYGVLETDMNVRALRLALFALAETGTGINEAMLAFEKDFDELERAGAGHPNYTGSASGTYNGLAEEYAEIVGGDQKGDGFGGGYVKALRMTDDIAQNIQTSGKLTLANGNLADAVWTLIGSEDSVFARIIDARRETVGSIESMREEYGQVHRLCEGKVNSAGAEVSRMKKDDYEVIDSVLVLKFYGGSFNWGGAGNTPAEATLKAGLLASNRGFGRGAKQALEDAENTVSGRGHGYLAVGIEKAGECIRKTREAETIIDEADALVASLNKRAAELSLEKRDAAERAIELFSQKSTSEKTLYDSAKAKLEKARLKEDAARGASSGKALLYYSEAVSLLSDIPPMLSEASVYLENKRGEAEKAIEELKEAISKAERDGIDVSGDADYADTAEVLLKGAKQDGLDAIISTCKERIGEIEQRAGAKYSRLDSLRGEIMNALGPDVASIRELRDDFETFEEYEAQFVQKDTVSPALALGSYKKLELFYERFSEKISQYKALLLQKSFESNSDARLIFEGPQALDKPGATTVEVTLRNPLAIGYSGPVAVEVPLAIPVRSQEITERPPEVENVAYADGVLLVLLKKADPNAQYRMVFKTNLTIAETKSNINEDALVGQNVLLRHWTVKFVSKTGAPIQAETILPIRPDMYSATINGRDAGVEIRPIAGGKVSAVVMGEAEAGDNAVFAEFTFEHAVEVRKSSENATPPERGFSYLVEVESPFHLKDVRVYVFEPALTDGDASIVGIGNWEPKSMRMEKSGSGGQISWVIEELPAGSKALFEVSVVVSDEAAFARRLYNDTETISMNYSLGWLIGELARADEFMKVGNFKKAISTLEEARSRLENELEQEGSSKAAFDIASKVIEGKIDGLNKTLALMGASGYDVLGEQERISDALERYDMARILGGRGDYEGALESADGSLALLVDFDYGPIFERRDNVSAEIGRAKKSALVMRSLTDTQDIISGIEAYEKTLNDAESLLRGVDYDGAIVLLDSAQEGAKNASFELEAAADSLISEFSKNATLFLGSSNAIGEQLKDLERATKFTESRVSKPSGVYSANAEELGRNFESIRGHLHSVLGEIASQGSLDFIMKNAPGFLVALEEISEAESLKGEVALELASLEKQTQRDMENAELALAQLSEIRGDEPAMKEEIETLRAYLDDSGKAAGDGRSIDSIALSTHVQKRVAYLLKTPRESGDGSSFLVAGASAILLIAIIGVFLFGRKKNPPEPKAVPRAGK
ncbi:MAG: hypothetical protein ABIF01_04860 [Candidatus Micrarchaeota archaeon]